MRKMVLGAILAAAAGSLVLGAGATADVTREATEIRVFVLDKSGTPVDVKNWTGAVDVTPEHGQRKAHKLDVVASKSPEGVKEEAKDVMLCGQVKQLDDWYVEMVVVRGGKTEGFSHTHDGASFKASVDEAAIKDPKTGVVNFKANVVFTLPNGDTKYVKGFEYPEGAVEGVLGRILDKDLKDTSKLDHATAAATARKIQAALQALPPLAFKNGGDRQEFEKAKQECMAACHRMEQASGKEIADAADKCKSALKELRSQAKDAQGALTAE